VVNWRGAAMKKPDEPDPLPDRPRRIIEAHGGTLLRETRDGDGCSLTITLPVIRPAMQMDALDTDLHDRNADNHLHILLAEDSLMNRKLAASLLEKKGHSVTQAVNGREAVSAFLVGHFDLVLMDIQMPLMNGYEATDLIRRMDSGRGAHVPIVALTASEVEVTLERCLEAGMDGMLNKPFRSNEFDLLLKQLKTEALHTRQRQREEQQSSSA